jgi:Mrp family chromosome partitioning ATPase
VFDSTPLLGIADASSLAARVSGVLLVVDGARTRAGALAHAVESLHRANATIWGVILNKVRARPGTDYYYYYYGHQSYGQPDGAAARNGAVASPPLRSGEAGERRRTG